MNGVLLSVSKNRPSCSVLQSTNCHFFMQCDCKMNNLKRANNNEPNVASVSGL